MVCEREKIMWILLDVIIAVIFIAYAVSGYKKGLLKSCLGIVVTIASIVITMNFYPMAAGLFRNTVVYKGLTSSLEETIEDYVGDTANADSIAELFRQAENTPGFGAVIKGFGVDSDDIVSAIESGKAETVDAVCALVVDKAAEFISNAAAIAAVFAASVIVLNIVINLLDLIFKLPILNFANRAGGLIAGLVMALLVSFVLCAAVRIAAPYMPENGLRISEEELGKTVLYSGIERINPLRFKA